MNGKSESYLYYVVLCHMVPRKQLKATHSLSKITMNKLPKEKRGNTVVKSQFSLFLLAFLLENLSHYHVEG